MKSWMRAVLVSFKRSLEIASTSSWSWWESTRSSAIPFNLLSEILVAYVIGVFHTTTLWHRSCYAHSLNLYFKLPGLHVRVPRFSLLCTLLEVCYSLPLTIYPAQKFFTFVRHHLNRLLNAENRSAVPRELWKYQTTFCLFREAHQSHRFRCDFFLALFLGFLPTLLLGYFRAFVEASLLVRKLLPLSPDRAPKIYPYSTCRTKWQLITQEFFQDDEAR